MRTRWCTPCSQSASTCTTERQASHTQHARALQDSPDEARPEAPVAPLRPILSVTISPAQPSDDPRHASQGCEDRVAQAADEGEQQEGRERLQGLLVSTLHAVELARRLALALRVPATWRARQRLSKVKPKKERERKGLPQCDNAPLLALQPSSQPRRR
jgi:hypothetical protein